MTLTMVVGVLTTILPTASVSSVLGKTQSEDRGKHPCMHVITRWSLFSTTPVPGPAALWWRPPQYDHM